MHPGDDRSMRPAATARANRSGWKELAWNGIRLAVPPDWEPARIEAHRLLLESESGPAMEVKWGPVRGGFSHQRHWRRLRRLGAAAGAAARRCPLPAAWEPALDRYDAMGFCWAGGGAAATGALFVCPRRRTAGLIQFFHAPGAPADPGRTAAVLDRLHLPEANEGTRWAVFDICAELPEEFRLIRHRFEPGRFTLAFAAHRCRVELARWAPAAVLLNNRGLEGFARSAAEWGAVRFAAVAGADPAVVEGQSAAPAGLIERLAAHAGRRTVCRARLWHVAARNRILGIRMQDRGRIDDALWEKVVKAYGLVAVPTPAAPHPTR